MKKSKLIIVGAGAAGIAAATKLVTHGVEDFVLLEAGNRIGGRVHTIPFEGNTSIDLGAQWIHGQKGNPVFEMAKEFNMTVEECPEFFKSLSFNSSGQPIDRENSLQLFELIETIMDDTEDIVKYNGSLGDYVRERLASDLSNHTKLGHLQSSPLFDDVLEFFEKFENSYDGSETWFETSAKTYDQYITPEGCPTTVWKTEGYSNVFKLLMKEMPGQTPIDLSKKILFNKEVENIRWEDPNTVVVKCADGTEYTTDTILTTVSLGVLKSRSELFAPPLPSWKANAIQGLSIGTVDKIFIKFPHKWWPDDNLGFNFFWSKGDDKKVLQDIGGVKGKPWVVDAFGFYLTTQDPLTFLGWVTGPSARYMETLSDEQVQIDTMKLFRHFLGANYTIPEPVRVLKSNWGTNKHFKGSYSCRSLTTDRLNTSAKDLGAPVENSKGKPVLLFAGEATHDHHYSTVHGAVASGWREADRILKSESAARYSSCIAKDFVIVGAGMAGLGAALTLVENGCTNFVLLEAQARAGGRVQSVPLGNGDYLEEGAQWIHGQENPVYRWAHQHRLTSPVRSDEAQGHYLKDDGTEVPLELVHQVAGAIGSMLEECEAFWNCQDSSYPQSIGHYLDEQFESYVKAQPPDVDIATLRQLYDWHRRFQIIDNSCRSLYELSAAAWGQYGFCGGDDYINLSHGFASVVDAMLRRLPAPLVRCRCPVKQVLWSHLAVTNDLIHYLEDQPDEEIPVMKDQVDDHQERYLEDQPDEEIPVMKDQVDDHQERYLEDQPDEEIPVMKDQVDDHQEHYLEDQPDEEIPVTKDQVDDHQEHKNQIHYLEDQPDEEIPVTKDQVDDHQEPKNSDQDQPDEEIPVTSDQIHYLEDQPDEKIPVTKDQVDDHQEPKNSDQDSLSEEIDFSQNRCYKITNDQIHYLEDQPDEEIPVPKDQVDDHQEHKNSDQNSLSGEIDFRQNRCDKVSGSVKNSADCGEHIHSFQENNHNYCKDINYISESINQICIENDKVFKKSKNETSPNLKETHVSLETRNFNYVNKQDDKKCIINSEIINAETSHISEEKKYSKEVNHTLKETNHTEFNRSFNTNMTDDSRRDQHCSSEKTPLEEVIVRCVDGTCYRAKRVLVTASLGYLKENQANMFVPRLPQHWSQAISSMGFASITKIFLVYTQPWWSPEDRGFQFLWTAAPVPQFDQWLREISGFDVLANQKSVLLGWVGGACAEEAESRTEEEIGEACTRLLSHFIGRDVPRPARVVRSSWHSNNYIRGAYSHTTTACDELGISTQSLTVPVSTKKRNVIYFAGEALHEQYFSTTHGAFLSGSDQAMKMLHDLRTGT